MQDLSNLSQALAIGLSHYPAIGWAIFGYVPQIMSSEFKVIYGNISTGLFVTAASWSFSLRVRQCSFMVARKSCRMLK